MEKRNYTIDSIKGILIVSIIFFHIVGGGEITHYFTYIFNIIAMPLFFGISGFLLKKEIFDTSFMMLCKKYYYRLVLPFILAYIIYGIIEMTIFNPLYLWFHLWFIFSFLMFIIYIYIIEKLHINKLVILLFSFCFTVYWRGIYEGSPGEDILYYLGDKRYYFYFIYFFFGYFLRNYLENIKNMWFGAVLLCIWGIYYFLGLHNDTERSLVFAFNSVLWNLSLIYLMILFLQNIKTFKIPYIAWMGQRSLPIYLWHILPLLPLQYLLNTYHLNVWMYILLYFIGVSIVIVIIKILQETSFGKKYLLGLGE